MHRIASIAALVGALAGCADALGPEVEPQAPRLQIAQLAEPHRRTAYRFDFRVASANAGYDGTMTLNLEEGRSGELLIGRNVPLHGGTAEHPAARQDVGLRIVATYHCVDGALMLDTRSDMSSAEGEGSAPVSIRKLSVGGTALVAPDKPVVVSSVRDPKGQAVYELTVVATALR